MKNYFIGKFIDPVVTALADNSNRYIKFGLYSHHELKSFTVYEKNKDSQGNLVKNPLFDSCLALTDGQAVMVNCNASYNERYRTIQYYLTSVHALNNKDVDYIQSILTRKG